MEQTKKCPYCGEEILAVAKKCKHCGEWLEERSEQKRTVPCPVCGEQIEEGTDVCPHCHEKIGGDNTAPVSKPNVPNKKSMMTYIIGVVAILAIIAIFLGVRSTTTDASSNEQVPGVQETAVQPSQQQSNTVFEPELLDALTCRPLDSDLTPFLEYFNSLGFHYECESINGGYWTRNCSVTKEPLTSEAPGDGGDYGEPVVVGYDCKPVGGNESSVFIAADCYRGPAVIEVTIWGERNVTSWIGKLMDKGYDADVVSDDYYFKKSGTSQIVIKRDRRYGDDAYTLTITEDWRP